MATRRKFLGVAVMGVASGAASAVSATHPDAGLIAMADEFSRLEEAYAPMVAAEDREPRGPTKDRLGAEAEVISDRQGKLYDAICDTPSRTPEGDRAKLRTLQCWIQKTTDGTPASFEDHLAWSITCDILGRA